MEELNNIRGGERYTHRAVSSERGVPSPPHAPQTHGAPRFHEQDSPKKGCPGYPHIFRRTLIWHINNWCRLLRAVDFSYETIL